MNNKTCASGANDKCINEDCVSEWFSLTAFTIVDVGTIRLYMYLHVWNVPHGSVSDKYNDEGPVTKHADDEDNEEHDGHQISFYSFRILVRISCGIRVQCR